MPLRDDYLRVKGRLKRGLGISSGKASSTSVGQETRPSRSPSPLPDTITQPQPRTPNDTGKPPSNSKSSPTEFSSLAFVDSTAATLPTLTLSAPNAGARVDPSTPRAVAPSMIPDEEPEPFERRKAVARSGLRTLLQIVESSAGVFPPLKSAVGGLDKFVEIFETASQGRKEFEELVATLGSLVEDTGGYVGRAGPGMTNSVKNLWIGLDEELKVVKGKYDRGGIQRFAEAMGDPKEIARCHRRIHGHLERLALNANLSVWEKVNESTMETRLRGLSPALSAVYNSAESERVKRRECTPGTRKEELEKLLEWARNKSPETEDVYWMNGMAGTGKTTIACSLCAELEASSKLGASFFCSRQIPECRNVNLIIPSIAYQLARFSIPFCHELLNVLKEEPDVHTRVLRTQFESLLAKPLKKVKNALPADFVIVIDALDECDHEDSVGLILDTLLSPAAGTLPVRFLLSSRPESEIYDRMMSRVGHSLDARLVLHNVDAELVRQDIKTYLQAELAAINPTPAQLAALVDLSGVLFIFASTAARYIIDGLKYMAHKKRLDMILGLSQKTPGTKGDGIDKLYASILKAVFENESIEESIRLQLKTMLDTVICAQEPLTVDAIAGLLGEESGKYVEVLLRRLSSVLSIAESSGLVTTLHASFPDYMLDHRRSASFHCNPQKTHARLSHACFEEIKCQDPQFNTCQLDSSYIRDDQDTKVEEVVGTRLSPHLFYACRYWMTHLKLVGEADEMQEQLWEFLSTRLLLWMEVLNLKKHMHLGPGIMQQAESWSRIKNYSQETVELAHDAWRFVTMFAGHAVSHSTPHIYVSMLPFWPSSSPISKQYQVWMHRGVQLQGTAVTRRRLSLLATWMFDNPIYVVCFSPDGSLIAVGFSSSACIIDSVTGRTILGPLAHDADIRVAAFSPDGTLLATGSEDHSIRMWSMANGDLIWQVIGAHSGYVVSLAFFPDGTRLVSGGGDKLWRVWDVGTGDTILGPIGGHEDAIISVSVSFDGTRIASGSTDETVRVWNAQTGGMILDPLEGHTDRVNSVCFSPDGSRLASGAWDNTVRIWSNLSGSPTIELLQEHTNRVESVAFSSDGKYIVSGSKDYTIRLWTGSPELGCVALHRGHTDTVYSVAFSHDSTRIVSGSHDMTLRVWDAQKHDEATKLLDGHSNQVSSVSFSEDGFHILSCSDDKTLCIWGAQSGQLAVGPFRGHTHWVGSVCFSPDGTQIVSGSSDNTVRWWDAHSGNSIGEPGTAHSDELWSVCFSPDGTLVASGSADRTVRLWNAQTHELIGTPLEGHTRTVRSVCFSPDGLRLVSGSEDQTVMVWDVESRRQVLLPLQGHTWGVTSVHISPDGTRIVSGSWDQTVRLWDAHTGEPLLSPLHGHTAAVLDVRFSRDGRYVVSCSVDKSLRIWNVQTGDGVGNPLLGHTEEVQSCSFSPCDRWIVSGATDGVIRVWDVADLVEVKGSKDSHQHDVQPTSHSDAYSWHLEQDGWVVDAQNRLLTWVPPDLRHVLMSPRNTLLISTDGSFRLEFDPTKLGEKWTDSYQG